MKAWPTRGRKSATTLLIAVSCIAFAGFGTAAEKKKPADGSVPLIVPKATCGPNDHPETALQGQVPAALRAAGFHGFNCNLELISQSKIDGANWQTGEWREGNGNGAEQGKGDGDREGRGDGDREGRDDGD